ncbi:MAG: DUF979 family protein, partial [Dokdonella sp.]
MLRIESIYWLVGGFLIVAAVFNARTRSWSTTTFWAVLACPFLFGEAILYTNSEGVRWPAQAMGVGVIALGVLAARGGLRTAVESAEIVQARRESARALGSRLFVPALSIPLLTLVL